MRMNSETKKPLAFISDGAKNRRIRRRIVLGIDPGVSTGLAALDLDGNLLFAKSEREISLDGIIQEVSRYGKVVLVATDVSPTPDLVRNVASKLNASIFTPTKSMEIPEKRELVNKYNLRYASNVSDSHARDALASGIKAYHRFKNKFAKLEIELADRTPITSRERTKELLVRGFSIARAIRESQRKPTLMKPSTIMHPQPETRPEFQKMTVEQAEVIARLNHLVESLQDEIKRLKSENLELRLIFEKERARSDIELRKDRLYATQRNQITDMRKRIQQLQEKLDERINPPSEETQSEIGSDVTLLKPIESFSSKGLEKAVTRSQIKAGDVVILLDASGGGASTAKLLAKLQPSLVVTCTVMSNPAEEVLNEHGIPIVGRDLLSIRDVRGNFYVQTKELQSVRNRQESLMKRKAKSLLEDAIETHRER